MSKGYLTASVTTKIMTFTNLISFLASRRTRARKPLKIKNLSFNPLLKNRQKSKLEK
jgi:hypothetical protein